MPRPIWSVLYAARQAALVGKDPSNGWRSPQDVADRCGIPLSIAAAELAGLAQSPTVEIHPTLPLYRYVVPTEAPKRGFWSWLKSLLERRA